MLAKQTNQQVDNLRFKKHSPSGFTLLEVMIAVSIFGFLMIYASQFMRLEIRLLDKATREDDLEHAARFAMLHTVDLIRMIPNPTLKLEEEDLGIYTSGSVETCKINLNPTDSETLPDGTIYYDKTKRKLMLKKETDDYLIAEHIQSIKFELDGTRLLKISILASEAPDDPDFPAVDAFKLITWVRF